MIPSHCLGRLRISDPAPRRGERATALVLVPAMMLVFIALAAIAVDLSAMHMTQRRAHAVISAAADDAAGLIDERALQMDGAIRIDSPMAHRIAQAHIAASEISSSFQGPPLVNISGDGRSLTIETQVRVRHIFLETFPGFGSEVITVRSGARLLG